jgi:actin-related protein
MVNIMNSTPIIIEIGNYSTKVGYSGESFPRIDIPSILGHPNPELDEQDRKNLMEIYGLNELPDLLCGDVAVYYSKLLNKIPLIYDEDFYDMDLFDYFLEYIAYSYEFDLKGKDIVLIQPFNSKIFQSSSELLFAKYNCKSIIPIVQPFANLVSTGIETGSALIVDIGHMNCNLIPIFRGNIVSEGLLRAYIGGNDIINLFEQEIIKLMQDQASQSLDLIDTYYLADDIKQSLGYVSLSPKREFRNAMDGKITKTVPLFGGESIEIHIPLYNSCEILFNPGKFGKNEYSIKDLITKSILNCTNTLREEIANNIILTGGTASLNGLRERLVREMIGELGDLAFEVVNFQDINDPRYSSWIGASKIISSGQDLTPIRMTREKFSKIGGEIKIDIDYYSHITEISLASLKTELAAMNPFDIALPLKYIYEILFNTLNQYPRINIRELSEYIRVPELRVIKMIYTLLARNLIIGEIEQETFDFINYGYGKDIETIAKTASTQTTSAASKTHSISPASRTQSTTEEYTPTYQEVDSPISEGLMKKMRQAQEIEPVQIDTSVPTFMRIADAKKNEWQDEESPVLTPEKMERMKQQKIEKLSKFSTMRIGETNEEEQKRMEAQKQVTQIPEELFQGPSFLYLDKLNKEEEKEPTDIPIQKPGAETEAKSEPEVKKAKSYFDLLESRTKPKEVKKIDPGLLTSEDLAITDDKDLKKPEEPQKQVSQKIEPSSKPKQQGGLLFTLEEEDNQTEMDKPRDAKLLVPGVPTFQLVSDTSEEEDMSKKVELDGLLQSSREKNLPQRKPISHGSDIPTFLKHDKLTKQQREEIEKLEEEEKKKKDKEPKLL